MGNTLVACCQPAGKETSVVSLRLTRLLSIVRKEKEKLSETSSEESSTLHIKGKVLTLLRK